MNYRHAYHAGNFADVVKHMILVAVLRHLRKKDAGFAVIDTHAGEGLYDIAGAAAAKTREAEEGIGKLPGLRDADALVNDYLFVATDVGPGRYPGSPLFAACLLRAQDRLVAIEMHRDAWAALSLALKPFRNARALHADGYDRLAQLLPPKERRGLVLIDPPYEAANEFARVAQTLSTALRRFANGIYVVWYPIKSRGDSERLAGEILATGASKILQIEVDVGRAAGVPESRLHAAGQIVINPPFGLAGAMHAALAAMRPRLGCAGTMHFDIRWLRGGE